MTKEELEKEAEEYTSNLLKGLNCNIGNPRARHINSIDVEEAYLAGAEPREKRITELEAQIEKMKCCQNCRHSRTEYEHCRTDKHEKWEIKEK